MTSSLTLKVLTKVILKMLSEFLNNFKNKTFLSTQKSIIFIRKKLTFYTILFSVREFI